MAFILGLFLQESLGVPEDQSFFMVFQDVVPDQFSCFFKAAVQIERCDQRFKSIGDELS